MRQLKLAVHLLLKRILGIFRDVLICKSLEGKLPRNSWINAIVSFRSVDAHERYVKVANYLRKAHCHKILDVGSGSASSLKNMGFQVVSLDVKPEEHLDIVASATHLPFRNNTFDSVSAVDVLEHINHERRESAVVEMKRCGRIVIVHTPLQNNEYFYGRVADLAILNFCKRFTSNVEQNTFEHVANGEPSPSDLERQGFRLLEPDWNLRLWLALMKPEFISFNLVSPLTVMLYLLGLRRVREPPYWGGYFIYED